MNQHPANHPAMPMKSSRRRSGSATCPFKVGERIRPIAKFDCHDYRRGESYEVTEIDPRDSTLRARDANGQTGSWIRWNDCEKADEIGWDWLKGELSAEALELLSAFDGLSRLRLRPDLRVALVASVPDLKGRILDTCTALETTSTNHP